MTPGSERYALITGASQGLGKAFAFECAQRGMNLLLVALPGPDLQQTREEITQRFPVKVDFLGIDLAQVDSAEQVFKWCQDKGYHLNVLINNAGIGHRGRFDQFGPHVFERIIMVNNMTLVKLCRLFLDDLRENDKAYLMNVGSIASYIDSPYKIVYVSTKTFILSFTRILRYEMRKTPVSVSVMCPSGIYTNEFVKDSVKAMGRLGRAGTYSPEMVARVSIRRMLRGKGTIKPGWFNRFMIGLSYILPYPIRIRITAGNFSRKGVPNYP
jgi:short-subunit dehydrogenase